MSETQPMSVCPWCNARLVGAAGSCPGCGGPLKLVPRKDDSGWVALPPIKDMSRLRIGNSTCQIEGEYVPVADFNLAEKDAVYFAHHVLLWRDMSVALSPLSLSGGWRRMFAGLPLVMLQAGGPGHIAFSRDEPGETIAVPLQAGQTIHAREHAFMVATQSVKYDWSNTNVWFTTSNGKDQETHYPIGMFIDHFSAAEEPGLLLLHARGNAFIRDLLPGQALYVHPMSFLFKDPAVRTGLHLNTAPYTFGQRQFLWLALIGPGRVGIQSAYPPLEGMSQSITATSGVSRG